MPKKTADEVLQGIGDACGCKPIPTPPFVRCESPYRGVTYILYRVLDRFEDLTLVATLLDAGVMGLVADGLCTVSNARVSRAGNHSEEFFIICFMIIQFLHHTPIY